MPLRRTAAVRLAFVLGLMIAFSGSSPRLIAAEHPVPESPLWLTYSGEKGPGLGQHIVLIAADQEYRSEYSMPMLARLLSQHHGFHCTVLFSLNKGNNVDLTQKIRWEDKTVTHNIPEGKKKGGWSNGTVVALTPVSLYRYPRGVGLAVPGGVLA